MAYIRTGSVFAVCIVLAGCATANIQPEDMSKLGAAPTLDDVDKIAHGTPIHRLDYLVDGQTYTFEIYEAADTAKYYGLLFQGGKLTAVDLVSLNFYSLGPGACTLFPPKPGMDVEGCLREANRVLQANTVDLHQPVTPNQQVLRRSAKDTAATAVEGTTYAVLLGPAVVAAALAANVVILPFIGAEKASEKSAQQSLGVKLGDPYAGAVQARVEQLPERERSVQDGSGTVLVPSGFSSIPAAAFGVEGGKVIWLQLDPPTMCGEGFMVWGMQCRLNTAPPAAWRAPHRPRPPVIDEWENIAVYYTPPPRFDVLGETTGKVGRGFTPKGRMEGALEDMKKDARKDGATALFVYPPNRPADQEPTAAPAAGTGTPAYGPPTTAPFDFLWLRGLELYVPADAEAFQKAAQLHASTCDALSRKKDSMKDAYKAMKDAGTPADVAAAKANLQAAEDAADAAYCGDDDWYAEQMAGHKS